MKTMIVTASRYGSTEQAAAWIAERLRFEKIEAQAFRAEEAPSPDAADLVILGSGIYAHNLLPELESYIDRHLDVLRQKKTALFALSMSPRPVFARGKSHGGLEHLDPLFRKLGPAVVHADMLGGQLIFSQLSPEDARALEAFYSMIKLAPEEIEERKIPRTLMSKPDAWDFARTVLKNAREKTS